MDQPTDSPQLWFRFAGVGRRRNILDFWRWALWDVRRAELRGMLAEYYVALALGMDETPRESLLDGLPWGKGRLRVRAALSRDPAATGHPELPTPSPAETRGSKLPSVFQVGGEDALAGPWVFCLVAPGALHDPLDTRHWSFCPAAGAPLARALAGGRHVTPARLAAAGLDFVSFDQLRTLLEPMFRTLSTQKESHTMTASATLPKTQYAVQLVGPSELRLNTEKEVFTPGPTQIVAKVEAVGLCFSDLKLLKQFKEHARKSEVVKGLAADVLAGIPSYVPGEKPTVPGHEVVCRIVAVGDQVKQHQVGERVLVQTDYRNLPTAGSNSAFGYNFEGALQEYVLMDERVVIDPQGERFLIPVKEDLGASQVALVEPWACVEDSYVTIERQTIKAGGRLLVVAEAERLIEGVYEAFSPAGAPAEIDVICADEAQRLALAAMDAPEISVREFSDLPNEGYDDIIYFGHQKAVIEQLNDKLGGRGIMNIVLGGKKIGALVNVGVGRVHYGLTRWIGTTGTNAAESYAVIPEMGEIRQGDKIVVIGAGGPMGQMHVIRNVCAGLPGLELVGTDMDDSRLASIEKKARPFAAANGVTLRMVNTAKEKLAEKFSYIAIMAPVGPLVAQAIQDSLPGALINIFAGIPAPVKQDLDLDTYIANRCFMFGTSGSTIRDMKIVLGKVTSGTLNTDASVDAVSGMAGATEGIAAVENRTLAGKIIVYPMLHELGLTPLAKLGEVYPTVAAKLQDGQWTPEAEQELLRVAR